MLPNRFVVASSIASAFLIAFSVAIQTSSQPIDAWQNRVELGLILRQLNTTGTFMMITAHPDDENNAVLAMLAKGQGVRAALVTATRGDGGQNEIGTELFDALAVLRTEELLAAHRLDGAEQYFTRAVDFGYSFSREETFDLWGREAILSDFVRLIRTIRPDVITGLTDEGQGGGQHHQASAILAREAYAASGDPLRFPEQLEEGLRPWKAKKFYFMAGFPFGFRGESLLQTPNSTTLDLDNYDQLLGRTYNEIGIHARSMHKCQGMSQLIPLLGPNVAQYRLAESSIPGYTGVNEVSLFDGIDTSIKGLINFTEVTALHELEFGLASISHHARAAVLSFEQGETHALGEHTLEGLVAVRRLRSQLKGFDLSVDARFEIDSRLELKERQFEQAVILAHGLRFEALADDGVVTRDQSIPVSFLVANRGHIDVTVKHVGVTGFSDKSQACESHVVLTSNTYDCSSDLRIPTDAGLTNIHWSHLPGFAQYDLDPDVPFGVPFYSTPFKAIFEIELASMNISIERPIEYRYSNDIFSGVKKVELQVVPKLAIEMTPAIAIVPSKSGEPLELRVNVNNLMPSQVVGEVTLKLPSGWTMMPRTAMVEFAREDESKSVRFTIDPGDSVAGEYQISAVVRAQKEIFGSGYQVVEYPHIGRRHLVQAASTKIKLLDVQIAPDLTIGYIDGVGDAVFSAIEQLGFNAEFIDGDQLVWDDLSGFDVIVIGVRAYERRADLRANNARLLQYVKEGGTLIVQYNKFEFNETQYGPFAAKVSRNRVTDENAAIRVLVNDHPVFSWPNQIDSSAWSNWVQERGLYFLGEKDSSYVDLVELEDSFDWNTGLKRGALVEARYGHGRWIYLGLGLWRQLPAGTTGAYELLANLLSLGALE